MCILLLREPLLISAESEHQARGGTFAHDACFDLPSEFEAILAQNLVCIELLEARWVRASRVTSVYIL